LNSSLQDALNLAWKLALVEKQLASPSLLSTYTEERFPVIATMLNFTTKIFASKVDAAKSGPSVSGSEEKQEWRPAGDALKQLGVNCRWSSIVIDERAPVEVDANGEKRIDAYGMQRGDIVRAGDRAPDAPGLVDLKGGTATTAESTSLFKVFTPTKHTVLLFSTDTDQIAALLSASRTYPADVIRTVIICPPGSVDASAVEGADLMLADRDGHAYAGYNVARVDTAVVIVRPDGLIGGIVKGADGLKKYFGVVFDAVAA